MFVLMPGQRVFLFGRMREHRVDVKTRALCNGMQVVNRLRDADVIVQSDKIWGSPYLDPIQREARQRGIAQISESMFVDRCRALEHAREAPAAVADASAPPTQSADPSNTIIDQWRPPPTEGQPGF
jgi:hypothetical protein